MNDLTQLIGKRIKFLFRDRKGDKIDAYTLTGTIVGVNLLHQMIKVKWDSGDTFSVHSRSSCILNKSELNHYLSGGRK